NIGKCIEKDPDTMNMLKRIVCMATTGLGPGNTTPVSEFNVYADAEAFRLLVNLDVDKLFVGFDMCVGDNAWNSEDIDDIRKEGTLGSWAIAVNDSLLKFNESFGMVRLDLPDAVAMSCICWPDTVIEEIPCYAYCCVIEEATYGQVIFYNERMMLSGSGGLTYPDYNCRLVTKFDGRKFAGYCKDILKKKITD
ncbi:MAG: nucleoside hydrolase, partial [Erysipelotrichaceae bacterium]|nr:nucleoside hydrolase [Erysipelotrichaceae bacterium]